MVLLGIFMSMGGLALGNLLMDLSFWISECTVRFWNILYHTIR